MRRATIAAVSVALCLVLIKVFAWLATGSVAMLSTLIDSLLDSAASIVNLIAVAHALQPADREHRFGHGKAEPLAGLGQSAFVAGSALFLLVEAAQRIYSPEPVKSTAIGIGVMVVSIVATLGLVAYQRRVIRRTGSVAISADSLHYKGDLLVNATVILALVLSAELGWQRADPLLATLVAGYILWNAWAIFGSSLDQLMDRELDDDSRDRIKALVLAHPDVLAMHDLRTRASGRDAFIQLHMELHGEMSLARAHQVSDEVEERILEAFPAAEVIIHQDPYGYEQPPHRTLAPDVAQQS